MAQEVADMPQLNGSMIPPSGRRSESATEEVGIGQAGGIALIYDPKKDEFIDGNPPKGLAGGHQGGWTNMDTSAAQDPANRSQWACYLRFRVWVPRKGRTLPEWMGILLHELVHMNCLKNHMAECLASYTGDLKKGADVKAHIDKCVADAKRKCGHDVGGEGWQATVVGQSFQRAAEVIGW